jgi:hypothetical protein
MTSNRAAVEERERRRRCIERMAFCREQRISSYIHYKSSTKPHFPTPSFILSVLSKEFSKKRSRLLGFLIRAKRKNAAN